MAAIIIPSSLETAQPTEVVRWAAEAFGADNLVVTASFELSLIHISEPTRLLSISYAVFCLKKNKHTKRHNQ